MQVSLNISPEQLEYLFHVVNAAPCALHAEAVLRSAEEGKIVTPKDHFACVMALANADAQESGGWN